MFSADGKVSFSRITGFVVVCSMLTMTAVFMYRVTPEMLGSTYIAVLGAWLGFATLLYGINKAKGIVGK